MKTADLCDSHDDVRVLAPVFRDFGGRASFHGRVTTLQVHEDNVLVRATLETPGNGQVLVVDGGGSLRTALVGGNLGKLAETNGWAGVVVFGAVRDVVELAACDVGIKALASVPRKSAKTGTGKKELAVSFAGVSISPGEWLYADEDGVIVAAQPLRTE